MAMRWDKRQLKWQDIIHGLLTKVEKWRMLSKFSTRKWTEGKQKMSTLL